MFPLAASGETLHSRSWRGVMMLTPTKAPAHCVKPKSSRLSWPECLFRSSIRRQPSRPCAILRQNKPRSNPSVLARPTTCSRFFSRSDMRCVSRYPYPYSMRMSRSLTPPHLAAWQCVDSLVFHFLRYASAARDIREGNTAPGPLPVIFHQCMLVFAQRYRNDSESSLLAGSVGSQY